ncbi:Pzf1 protein [Saccharomycopsis crataegensis]|uniref:Pzf1 protein n=1 Tax=Saccharomycopsis crataegensis TaxID=43959 RepID=A0AAV5QKY4_9ASCO|nr:Pzf1 protein [Saccharomycopsis crataegensis]
MAQNDTTDNKERLPRKRRLSEGEKGPQKKQLSIDSQESIVDSPATEGSNFSSLSGTPNTSRASSRSSSLVRGVRGGQYYPCDFEGCDKVYKKPSLLKQHQLTHTNERPFHCTHLGCEMAFFRKDHLNRHILSHREINDKPLHCAVCGKGVSTVQQLKRHEVTHVKNIKCTYEGCSESFYKKSSLKAHIARDHEKSLMCKDCGKVFERPYRLADHRAKHHGAGLSQQCTHGNCLKMFKTWSALQLHIKTDHPKIKCKICGKPCVGESGLRMHMYIHDEAKAIKTWNCRICELVFRKKRELSIHYGECHYGHSFELSANSSIVNIQDIDNSDDDDDDEDDDVSDVESVSSVASRKSISDLVTSSRSVFDIFASQGEKKIKTLPCEYGFCDRMFKTHHDLRRHMKWHEGFRKKNREILGLTGTRDVDNKGGADNGNVENANNDES